MDKNVLMELLAEACGRRGKGGVFEFSEQEKASLLVSTGGPMLLVDEIGRVELKDGYTTIRAGRTDLFVIETERIIGVKLQRSKRDGAGFVAS